MEAAAEGLAYLHHHFDEAIMHRDVKNANLLVNLDTAGRPRCAAWCDLGLARTAVLDMSPDIGSRETMAPEVQAGARYSCSADTYSFGVSMVELYASTSYTGDANSAVPQRLLKYCPEIFGLLAPCIAERPRDRPDMKEVVLQLPGLREI